MGIFIFLIHNTQTSQKYLFIFFCRSPFDKESTLGELKLSVSVLQRLWELGVFDLDAEIAQIASYFVNIERIWPDFFFDTFLGVLPDSNQLCLDFSIWKLVVF